MSENFLDKYTHFLKQDGLLEFKTDNRELFDYALTQVPVAGWEVLRQTYDLHNDEEMSNGNIMTEYEERFSSMGNPICKYIIKQERVR